MAGIRRVIARVAAIFVILVVVAIFVFWYGWVRAPSPEEICAHKSQLVIETAPPEQREGAEALVAQLEVKCIQAAQRKIKLRGKLVYAKYAKCVMAATTLTEFERC